MTSSTWGGGPNLSSFHCHGSTWSQQDDLFQPSLSSLPVGYRVNRWKSWVRRHLDWKKLSRISRWFCKRKGFSNGNFGFCLVQGSQGNFSTTSQLAGVLRSDYSSDKANVSHRFLGLFCLLGVFCSLYIRIPLSRVVSILGVTVSLPSSWCFFFFKSGEEHVRKTILKRREIGATTIFLQLRRVWNGGVLLWPAGRNSKMAHLSYHCRPFHGYDCRLFRLTGTLFQTSYAQWRLQNLQHFDFRPSCTKQCSKNTKGKIMLFSHQNPLTQGYMTFW